ncbi:MAG: serine/threonine-protein kinase [Gammaproteobacteria bacterium]|nr:serine/threonine-protein kinase [Gammaproteobacteria bacterium]
MDKQPQNIGKFEIIRELGRGAMGVVYLGHDPFANRDVAIKVAHQESLQDEQQGGRFRKMLFNEAKVAGRLKHPNIIRVYDAGVEDDASFIVMEYIAGNRSLYDHARPDSLLPMEDVVRMMFKCARALDCAHRQGVVHRDIKPRNILLTEDFDVKIGDFSIALVTRADATETQVYGYVGSPLYMSPEQVREEDISNQSDIFSIGVVMYEMLTGRNPFSADSLPAIVHQITEKPHAPLREARSDAPEILAHIVDRALMKNPAERYKSALDLAADLSLVYDHLKLFEEELSGGEKYKLVKDLAFFNSFSESEVWEIINAGNWLEFEPGEQIIAEGELDNSFYVLISGTVRVLRGDQELDQLGAGDCFGEMGFIAGKERTASIVASSPVTTLMIRASLIERASLHCQLRFHKVFLNTLVERLSLTSRRVSA